MANVFYVYVHLRNDTCLPFYVGKGCNSRAYSKSDRNNHWLNIVDKHGYTVYIQQYFDDEIDALKAEEKLIKHYQSIGYKLANILSGGLKNTGKRHTEKSKEMLRIAHTGRKQSKEVIENRRNKLIGVKKSNAHRFNLSKARTGITVPLTYKQVYCKTNNTIYESVTKASIMLGVDKSHISKCCRNKIKKINGYSFEYMNI